MKPIEPGDEELRDDTLRRALAQAPDRAQLPDWRVRQAILAHARDAVAALEELQAASREPTPWWRLGWWRDKVGTPGRSMPWNAAFATLAVAVLVTVLWQREPVPGARLDERPVPAAPAPIPADAARGEATVRGAVQQAEDKKKERSEEEAAREAPPVAMPQQGPSPPPPPSASAPAAVTPASPAPTPAQPPAAPASVAPAAPAAAPAPALRTPSAEARSTRPAEREQPASPPTVADAAPASRAAPPPEAGAKSAARDQVSRSAQAPASAAPAPAPAPAAESPSRQRAAGTSSLAAAPAAPAEPGVAGAAARGKAAAASDARTDATPLPSFASLGQWTQLRLANVSGEVRIVPRAEAGELSQLLSSAAIMAVGAQPMRALSEWRVSLERRGDVLAVLEVGRNQVRWTEGALPPATGTPPIEALDALRLSLRNAMKPGAPGRPLEPAALPRPSPPRAPEAAPPAASAEPSAPPVVPAAPASPPALAVPVAPPAPPVPEPATPLMPPLEPAAPGNGAAAPPS